MEKEIIYNILKPGGYFLDNHHGIIYLKVKNDFRPLMLISNPAGCGSYILKYWSTIEIEHLELFLNWIKEKVKTKTKLLDTDKKGYTLMDVGAIMTVAGKKYIDTDRYNILIKHGFKVISEYENPRHAGNYKQQLLLWKI